MEQLGFFDSQKSNNTKTLKVKIPIKQIKELEVAMAKAIVNQFQKEKDENEK